MASFFLSRIDVLLDPMLEKKAKEGGPDSVTARGLQGQIAIASAKMAYQIYKEIFDSDRFRRLAAAGARPQRLLWASTEHQEPGLQRRQVRGAADRPRHRQHHAP